MKLLNSLKFSQMGSDKPKLLNIVSRCPRCKRTADLVLFGTGQIRVCPNCGFTWARAVDMWREMNPPREKNEKE